MEYILHTAVRGEYNHDYIHFNYQFKTFYENLQMQ